MKLTDALRLASSALLNHKRRTLLSLLGVAIGVAAVLVLTALGEGARGFVRGQFASLGANLVAVLPGKTETTGGIPGFGGTANDLTLEDAEALRRGLRDLCTAAPVSLGNETVSHRERSRQVIVLGTTSAMAELRDSRVSVGRFLPEAPWDRGAPVAVIGSKLAEELFPATSPLGSVVRLGSSRLRVIGVLEPQGTHLGIDMDETVLVPVATGMRMFDQASLFRVLLGARAYADIEVVKQRCTQILAERHGEEDFTLITQDAVLGSLGSLLGMLTLALAGIAAISLSVAGIGIMNVMLVSVSERTSEIGLLKAVGAAPAQIRVLFLGEAILLSLAGGLVGLACGEGVVALVRGLWPAFPASTPGWAVASALGLSVFVGVLFGVLPARRAMRLDPVVALGGKPA